MWNLKYDTNELIYEKETDSQTESRLVVVGGRRGGRVVDWDFGISRRRLIYSMDKQSPTVWHRELFSISCYKP